MRMRGPGAVDDVFITDIVWPRWADATSHRDGGQSVSRPAVTTLRLVERVEDFGDAFVNATNDGRIDAEEMTRLIRLWKPIPKKANRVHENAQGAIRALSGDGIYSPWFRRMVRESHAAELRIVVRNDDPDPSGPGAARASGTKKAA